MNVYVTTSIPYVNGNPHIGHALELVQADAIARYNRLTGNATVFQTGTDENAYKNVIAADEQGISVQTLVDENSSRFRELVNLLQISADTFIRTTDPMHKAGVAEFWNCLKQSDIYKKTYKGFYCTGCEDFLLDKDLTDGKCPDHLAKPVLVEEQNYFFRLSAYQSELEHLISKEEISVVPETRKNEVLSFIRGGLQDISVSRDAGRMSGWGIPVPGDETQIIYVWIDALINYVTGQEFGSSDDWREIWNPHTHKLHVIGKNVWKFHAVYWPALLLSAGLPVPSQILVHGFLTVEGQKISKSLGNSVDPFHCIESHGAEILRYYLLSLSPFEDGDYSEAQLRHVYTTDLSNGIGNLASRITTLCGKAALAGIKSSDPPRPPDEYAANMSEYRFNKALQCMRNSITSINQEIDRTRPWEQLESDKTKKLLAQWSEKLYTVAYWLQPFLPLTALKIIESLSGNTIARLEPTFPRKF